MKLLVNIILFGSLFAQSIDSEASETFIESLLEDLNREKIILSSKGLMRVLFLIQIMQIMLRC